MSFPFFRRKPQVIGSSDPRAMIAGYYRHPNNDVGGEIRVGDTRPKVIIGGNSAGKGAGVILRNLLTRTGVSQFVIDTRLQAAAVAAPWRRTVDDDVFVSNSYGSLAHLPEYADLQGGAGINLLDAPELDPDNPLVFDHLNVMAETAFPSEADSGNSLYFSQATQSLFIALVYGELRAAKREGRKPLMANVRIRALERSEYDPKTGEPVRGLAATARELLALNNPVLSSYIDRFGGLMNDELLSVVGTFEAKSRWMMSPMLAADERRGGLDFGEMGRRVCSGFLGVPTEHVDGAAPWFRLAISKALRPLFAPHEIPVTFWIDEFYALKRIPAIEAAIGVVAGSKLEIIIVVQSLSMLAHLYSKVWEAFLGQASAIILVGSPGDHFTCDYLVKRSCERTIVQPHIGTSINGGGVGLSAGDAFHTRPTLTHADLYNLKPGTGFVWLSGLADPIPAAYPGWYTDPVLSRRGRRDPYVRW